MVSRAPHNKEFSGPEPQRCKGQNPGTDSPKHYKIPQMRSLTDWEEVKDKELENVKETF